MFADATSDDAKAALADILEQLGFGSENATWRNAYLTGARELRHGVKVTPLSNSGMLDALTITQLFDTVAIRLDGARAAGASVSVRWQFTDSDEVYRMELSNGALVHFPTERSEPADLTITLTRAQLPKVLAGWWLGRRRRQVPCALRIGFRVKDDANEYIEAFAGNGVFALVHGAAAGCT